MAVRLSPGRRPDGHQHAGHGRHRRDRAARRPCVPGAAVVMMSVQGEADYLRRSMLAGAREFLVKPFSSDELTASIRQVSARERDKQSRMAVAAVTAAGSVPATDGTRSRRTGRARPGRRGLQPQGRRRPDDRRGQPGRRRRDRARQEGRHHGRLLPVRRRRRPAQPEPARASRSPTSSPSSRSGELDSIDTFLINHTAGIRVLLAPPSPETAEMITAGGVKKVLEPLRADHDLVVVDCTSFFNDTTLAILDAADVILTMLSLEITSIKNMRLFLEVAEQLGYENGQGPARPQPRRFGARHPRRGRRALDRPEGRRDDRQRRPKRGLRPESWRTVLPLQPGGAGLPGHPSPGPVGGRWSVRRPPPSTPESRPRRNRCSHGDERSHSRPLGARRGVGDVPAEADRERSTGSLRSTRSHAGRTGLQPAGRTGGRAAERAHRRAG